MDTKRNKTIYKTKQMKISVSGKGIDSLYFILSEFINTHGDESVDKEAFAEDLKTARRILKRLEENLIKLNK